MPTVESLAEKVRALMPFLNEKQCRLYLATEAISLGRGGIRSVAKASGVTPERISRGIAELKGGVAPKMTPKFDAKEGGESLISSATLSSQQTC